VKTGLSSEGWLLTTTGERLVQAGVQERFTNSAAAPHRVPYIARARKKKRSRAFYTILNNQTKTKTPMSDEKGAPRPFSRTNIVYLHSSAQQFGGDGDSRSSTSDLSNRCCGNEAMGDRER
jgi:hypothetical protein